MIDHQLGIELHQKHFKGEPLTEQEEAQLQAWYAQEDEAETKLLQVTKKKTMEEMLNNVSKMKTAELEVFLKEVAHLLAQRKAPIISKQESQLLLKINKPLLPAKAQTQLDLLHQKLQEETISNSEHKTLMTLISRREKKGVKRLEALIELAQLKKQSPKDLMKKMGLSTLSYA